MLQGKIAETDAEIAAALDILTADRETPAAPPPRPRHSKSRNEPHFDVRSVLYQLLNADVTQIHALGPYTVLRMVAECGTDMTKWPTVKHFTSWLTLCPGSKISGGRVLSAKARRSSNRVAALLRTADCGGQCRAHADRARRLLSSAGGAHRQSQSGDGHGAQARGALLHRAPLRHGLRGPRR